MTQLELAQRDPPSRPPTRDGEHVESEVWRSGRELVRVSCAEYNGRRLVELSVWRVRGDNGRWFRARVLRVGPGECAELGLGLQAAARRARR